MSIFKNLKVPGVKKGLKISVSFDTSLDEQIADAAEDLGLHECITTEKNDIPIQCVKQGEKYAVAKYKEIDYIWDVDISKYQENNEQLQVFTNLADNIGEEIQILKKGFNIDYRDLSVKHVLSKANKFFSRSKTVQIFSGNWMRQDGILKVGVKSLFILENSKKEALVKFCKIIGKARDLRHPYVLRIHGGCFTPGRINLVTKFCHYGDLHTLLRKHPWIDLKMRLRFALEILQAMRYLERQGISVELHLSNVFIDNKLSVQVLPISIKTFEKEGLRKDLIVCDEPLNKIRMVPPEFVDLKTPMVSKGVYQTGICMYALLSGQTFPFVEDYRVENSFNFDFNVEKLPCNWVKGILSDILGKPKRTMTLGRLFESLCKEISEDSEIGGLLDLAFSLSRQKKKEGIVVYVREPGEDEEAAEDMFVSKLTFKCLSQVLEKWKPGFVPVEINARVDDSINATVFKVQRDEDVARLENDSLLIVKIKNKYDGVVLYIRDENDPEEKAEDFLLKIISYKELVKLIKKNLNEKKEIEEIYVFSDEKKRILLNNDISVKKELANDVCVVVRFRDINEKVRDDDVIEKLGTVVYLKQKDQDGKEHDIFLKKRTFSELSEIAFKTFGGKKIEKMFTEKTGEIKSDKDVAKLEDDTVIIVEHPPGEVDIVGRVSLVFTEEEKKSIEEIIEFKKPARKTDGVVIYIRTDEQPESEAEDFFLSEKKLQTLKVLIQRRWATKKIDKIFLNKERSIFYEIQSDADVKVLHDDSQIIVRLRRDENVVIDDKPIHVYLKKSESGEEKKVLLQRKTFFCLKEVVEGCWKGFTLLKAFYRFGNRDLKRIRSDGDVKNLKENSTLIIKLKPSSEKNGTLVKSMENALKL